MKGRYAEAMATAVQSEKSGCFEFELIRGQLWRKATEDEPSKYVVCTYESFEQIKAVHLELEHAGIDKTYGRINERYYGITKEEVACLLTRCIPCQVCIPISSF